MTKNLTFLLVAVVVSLLYGAYAFKKGGLWAGLLFAFIWVLVFLWARRRYRKIKHGKEI